MARLPNLYVVGAPRSGTTSLARWLGYHPDITMSRPKEPAFHNDDQTMETPRATDRDRYLESWGSSNAALLGEGTTWYLYSTGAARSIHAMNPESKIVILLRDPAEMLASLHNHHVFSGLETERDFESAVFGSRPASEGDFRRSLDYLDVGTRAPQISRYLDLFGREQVAFVDFTLLATNPQSAHIGLLRSLGVTPEPLVEYKLLNPGRHFRSGMAERAVDKLAAIPAPGHLWNRLRRLNTATGRPLPSSDLRRKIIGELEDDIRKVEELSGMRFPSWRDVVR